VSSGPHNLIALLHRCKELAFFCSIKKQAIARLLLLFTVQLFPVFLFRYFPIRDNRNRKRRKAFSPGSIQSGQ
jgi:hypothetical protein